MLETLIGRQRELGETDAQFAARLGVPRTTWTMTRIGQKPLRNRVIVGAVRAFPELREVAASFLLSDVTSETASDAVATAETAA